MVGPVICPAKFQRINENDHQRRKIMEEETNQEKNDWELYRHVRKLRKKLRQIEHLESCERDLNDEELDKVK